MTNTSTGKKSSITVSSYLPVLFRCVWVKNDPDSRKKNKAPRFTRLLKNLLLFPTDCENLTNHENSPRTFDIQMKPTRGKQMPIIATMTITMS